MKHAKLGCCYFPTNVVFVDDNENFLDSITMGLSSHFRYKTFSKIREFNQFLAKNTNLLKNNSWTKPTDSLSDCSEYEQHEIAVNLHLIHEQIYNLQRYDEISVVVVDYAMPECNGIDLCKTIRQHNLNIQILLLTGEADHQIAVDAFNKGLIDKFILKEKIETLGQKLNDIIAELAQNYFLHALGGVNSNLVGENSLQQQQPYLELFQSAYENHHACEYYLIDPSGGYLMLDENGNAKWLIVKNEEDIHSYCELAHNEQLDESIIMLLKQRKLMPFYHGEYLNIPLDEWKKHLLTADTLSTNGNTYAYAMDTGFENSVIEVGKIRFFQGHK